METVSFFTFLEEKITEILFQLFFLAVVAFLLIFYGVDTLFVVSLVILFISIQGLFQWCLYRKKRNASQHIIDLVDGLEETYYIADVLPKPPNRKYLILMHPFPLTKISLPRTWKEALRMPLCLGNRAFSP